MFSIRTGNLLSGFKADVFEKKKSDINISDNFPIYTGNSAVKIFSIYWVKIFWEFNQQKTDKIGH